ncbi:putative Rho GTPase activation protein [Septoria linicola]|nr:putative Rho GTPase activation protein [Septoria linicola]
MSTSNSLKSKHSRGASNASSSSLMQDVPGAFPTTPIPHDHDDISQEHEDEQNEVTFQSLSQAVYARRAEFVRPKHVRIKIGTWNTAAIKGTEKDVGAWFVGGKGVADDLTGATNIEDRTAVIEDATEQESRYERKKETLPRGDESVLPHDEDVGLYVLGLQEVVDITAVGEALKPYTDPAAANKWKEAMQEALPSGYQLVAEQQLIGLLLLVYASPVVARDVKAVSTTSVGTGVFGYMGNKGAVTARLVLGDTTRLIFVNSHLAAGADKTALERRIWDAQQIVQRTKFEPIKDAMDLNQSSGEMIGDEDFAFWCGDLNFRMEGIPGDDVRRLLMLHTRNQYDLSQPASRTIEDEVKQATASVKDRLAFDENGNPWKSSDSSRPNTLLDDIQAEEDPAALQTTLDSLLPHDELRQQMHKRKAFHDGWREGPITFLPTYKYDAGSVGVFDSSEKKRAPSWCDRILYRTRKDKLAYEAKVREEQSARKKDEEMRASGIDQAASEEDVLYDYDPDTDGATGSYDEYDEYDDAAEDSSSAVVVTREGFEDELTMEYYTAHQRVLSSDHKPLDASFLLKYDAVVPELKAQIHAECAKELDKAENEGRPNVTIVVDKQTHTSAATSDESLPGGRTDEGVSFGDVRWMQVKQRSLTIANTSRVPANFSFIERPVQSEEQAGIAPRWLTIKIEGIEIANTASSSPNITLEPGETAMVELDLKISNMNDVRNFNAKGKPDVDDILVLRIENGRDHFIPIRGHWLESSLARTIDTLIRIPEGGIRKLQGQRPSDKHGKENAPIKNAVHAVSATTALASGTSGDTDLSRVQSNGSAKSARSAKSAKSSTENELPVRFSAPRELFRLTEAIEELSTRVVAEWEMMHDVPPTPTASTPSSPRTSISSVKTSFESMGVVVPPTAPWDMLPAWPFDAECWSQRDSPEWDAALSQACDALDSDAPLEASLPDTVPRIERLYVLSSLLLMFLRSMPDGVITGELWTEIDAHLNSLEKTKSKRTNDDQRTSVQEILSSSPSHSITFVLITSMLERMIQEVSGNKRAAIEEVPSIASPLSPTKKAFGGLKRIATWKGGKTAQVAGVSSSKNARALADVFAPVVIRTPEVAGEKSRATQEKKRIDVMEVFLTRDEPG